MMWLLLVSLVATVAGVDARGYQANGVHIPSLLKKRMTQRKGIPGLAQPNTVELNGRLVHHDGLQGVESLVQVSGSGSAVLQRDHQAPATAPAPAAPAAADPAPAPAPVASAKATDPHAATGTLATAAPQAGSLTKDAIEHMDADQLREQLLKLTGGSAPATPAHEPNPAAPPPPTGLNLVQKKAPPPPSNTVVVKPDGPVLQTPIHHPEAETPSVVDPPKPALATDLAQATTTTETHWGSPKTPEFPRIFDPPEMMNYTIRPRMFPDNCLVISEGKPGHPRAGEVFLDGCWKNNPLQRFQIHQNEDNGQTYFSSIVMEEGNYLQLYEDFDGKLSGGLKSPTMWGIRLDQKKGDLQFFTLEKGTLGVHLLIKVDDGIRAKEMTTVLGNKENYKVEVGTCPQLEWRQWKIIPMKEGYHGQYQCKGEECKKRQAAAAAEAHMENLNNAAHAEAAEKVALDKAAAEMAAFNAAHTNNLAAADAASATQQ